MTEPVTQLALGLRIRDRLEEHCRGDAGANLRFLEHLAKRPTLGLQSSRWNEWEDTYNELASEATDGVTVEDLWDLTEGLPELQRSIRLMIFDVWGDLNDQANEQKGN